MSFGFAQNPYQHYLFDQFQQGSFLFKSGKLSTEMLNYNTLTKEVVMLKGDKKAVLLRSNLKNIDTVYIKERTFVPYYEKFRELLINSEVLQVFVDYECTLKSKKGGINPNNVSSTNVSENVNFKDTNQKTMLITIEQLEDKDILYELNLPSPYLAELKFEYLYIKDNKKTIVKNMNQFKKLYSDYKKEFNTYRKENRVEFDKQMSVKSLIDYLEKLN